VVYLIRMAPLTEQWWAGLAEGSNDRLDPESDRSLPYVDRAICDDQGDFRLDRVRPGDYYVYGRMISGFTMNRVTTFSCFALLGTATVAVRETTSVTLRSPLPYFQMRPLVRRFPPPSPDIDPELPRFGEYVPVDQLPTPQVKVQAKYPPEARAAGLGGTVLLQVLVGKDGQVKDVRIQKSIPALDGAAEEAVRRWVFKPALSRNNPVAAWIAVPIRFPL
jgi:TonB family protein